MRPRSVTWKLPVRRSYLQIRKPHKHTSGQRKDGVADVVVARNAAKISDLKVARAPVTPAQVCVLSAALRSGDVAATNAYKRYTDAQGTTARTADVMCFVSCCVRKVLATHRMRLFLSSSSAAL
jgi:hypothetical protein